MDDGAIVAVFPVALRGREDGAELEYGEAGDPAYALRAVSGGSSKPMIAITCVTGDRTHALTAEGADASEDGTGRGTPIVNTPFAFHENSRAELRVTDIAGNLTTGGGKTGQGYPAIHDGIGVRRLCPTECERLQGYEDDWNATGINEKGVEVPISDAQRYRQLGNSLAIPIFEDIAHRLVDADERYP